MYCTADGIPVEIAKRLKKGGQGEVFAVVSPVDRVFKKFLPDLLDKELVKAKLHARLKVMVSQRPPGWREKDHVLVAWPTDVVLQDGDFTGFLMPRIDTSQAVLLHEVANPSDRSKNRSWTKGFTWQYLLRTAENLALATDTLHNFGVIVGDFNEQNIFVTQRALVTLVDCDSMQVRDRVSGNIFLCEVGQWSFTAPELLGKNFETTVREKPSDLFALAVHIHQLLFAGNRPFDGVWKGVDEQDPLSTSRTRRASEGLWTYSKDPRLVPAPSSGVNIDRVPPELVDLFLRAFVDGARDPNLRPTGAEWQDYLGDMEKKLERSRQSSKEFPWNLPVGQSPLPKVRPRHRGSPRSSPTPAGGSIMPRPTPGPRRWRLKTLLTLLGGGIIFVIVHFALSSGSGGSITAVTFSGSARSPTVTITGHFEQLPTAKPIPQRCSPGGKEGVGMDYDGLQVTDKGSPLAAGGDNSCIGLVVTNMTHSRIIFTFGSSYSKSYTLLSEGSSYTVWVDNYMKTGTVRYVGGGQGIRPVRTSSPGITGRSNNPGISSVTFSGSAQSPTITIMGYFEELPVATPKPSQCQWADASKDYGYMLWIADYSDGLAAGGTYSCVGLVVTKLTHYEIIITFAESYDESGALLTPGSTYGVYMYSSNYHYFKMGTVRYAP